MNHSLSLLLAIGDIDNRHITEIENNARHRRTIQLVQAAAIAACFALLIAMPCTILLRNSKPHIPSTQTTPSGFISTQMPAPENITFDELVKRADIIVRATVVAEHRAKQDIAETDYLTDSWLSAYTSTKHSTVYSLSVEITVDEVLKGNISSKESVHIFNGALEEYDQNGAYIRTQYLNDTKLMKKGDNVILFLNTYTTKETHYFLVGEAGKWFLDADGTYKCGLLYDDRFPTDYTPRVGLKQYSAYTLDEMQNKIQH